MVMMNVHQLKPAYREAVLTHALMTIHVLLKHPAEQKITEQHVPVLVDSLEMLTGNATQVCICI